MLNIELLVYNKISFVKSLQTSRQLLHLILYISIVIYIVYFDNKSTLAIPGPLLRKC